MWCFPCVCFPADSLLQFPTRLVCVSSCLLVYNSTQTVMFTYFGVYSLLFHVENKQN